MRAEVKTGATCSEFETAERCYITELANDAGDEFVSIAKARVEPGVRTAWHRLLATDERYIVVSGCGRVEVGKLRPLEVFPGDVVRIPADTAQRITNTGDTDLVFFAVCTPPFKQSCYQSLE